MHEFLDILGKFHKDSNELTVGVYWIKGTIRYPYIINSYPIPVMVYHDRYQSWGLPHKYSVDYCKETQHCFVRTASQLQKQLCYLAVKVTVRRFLLLHSQ